MKSSVDNRRSHFASKAGLRVGVNLDAAGVISEDSSDSSLLGVAHRLHPPPVRRKSSANGFAGSTTAAAPAKSAAKAAEASSSRRRIVRFRYSAILPEATPQPFRERFSFDEKEVLLLAGEARATKRAVSSWPADVLRKPHRTSEPDVANMVVDTTDGGGSNESDDNDDDVRHKHKRRCVGRHHRSVVEIDFFADALPQLEDDFPIKEICFRKY
ncbi:unnamed protein product [Pseudo-nitzschia multistriata]|uniref:Uncharacterized protein n=1 Tax=Pseudo-nitzschia multistriata TaxID=183589 RepID=A0A448YW33_9STRA|nr:unnamed protein product [Pseudo-nitzschia multistriata]